MERKSKATQRCLSVGATQAENTAVVVILVFERFPTGRTGLTFVVSY